MKQPTGRKSSPFRALVRTTGLLLFYWQGLVAGGFSQELPESPAIPPDVVPTIDGRQVHGHVSERRSSHDGRVRIRKKQIYTSKVELYARHVPDEPRDSDGKGTRIDSSDFHASSADDPTPGHITICDPYLASGATRNPHVCWHNGQPADCYDVSVVQLVHFTRATPSGRGSEVWTTPVTITVRKPKTRHAAVAKVELRGQPVRSPIERTPRKSGNMMFEPVTSGDGRLLILNSGDTLLYSVMGRHETPCDARNWKRLDHLSRMHRDPLMERYGIARYPIRDSENRKVKAGRRIRGAYPWIDREVKNLFFTQVGGTGLFYRDADDKIRSRFEVVNRPRNRDIVLPRAIRFGMAFLGLWSQGKIVIPDTRVNNIDFHTGTAGFRPRLKLYGDEADAVPVQRSSIVDINSSENQWNYRPAFRPRSPRDVVWWLSASNRMTDEVVFDHVLEVGSLIFSPMNAAVNNKKRAWRDGFDYSRFSGYVNTPRIQNAAASQLLWKIPPYGKLIGARVEPIAAGGVTAKGLWLDGARSRLEYSVPDQANGAMRDATWTTALWIDVRELGTRRRLLTFPDGSWVDITAGRLFVGGSGPEASIDLPSALQLRSRQWTHVAFVSRPDGIDFYLQGFKFQSLGGSSLRIEPGLFTVGRPRSGDLPGFHGWIDELRVVSGARDPEVICNDAHGSLRGLDAASQGADFAAAGSYPLSSHQEISARLESSLRRTYERYRCERERDSNHPCLEAIHRFSGGEESCVRPALLFPEGPLFHDLPRPDSRANPFCRSCHLQEHPTPSLRTAKPLKAGPEGTALAEDRRRQPSQAPVLLHGFVPRALFGLPNDLEAPPEGLLLDPLLYPGARDAASPD